MPGPRASTTRTCVSLRSNQLGALKGLARETGAPIAELTRKAIDAFLTARVADYLAGSQHPEPTLYETESPPSTSRS
jgi:hypothetical protein